MAGPKASLTVSSTTLLDEKLGKKAMYLAITIDGIFARSNEMIGTVVNWNFWYEFPWQSQRGITFRLMKSAIFGADKVEGEGSISLFDLFQQWVQNASVPLLKKSKVIGHLNYELRLTAYAAVLGGPPAQVLNAQQYPPASQHFPASGYAVVQPISLAVGQYPPLESRPVFNRSLGIADIQLANLIYQTADRQVEVHNCRILPQNTQAIVKISHCSTSDRFNTVQKEGLIMCKMTHPNICACYENLLDNRSGAYDHWLVMEYIDGVNLNTEIQLRARERRPWTERELKKHAGDMVDAFAYMQAQSVCHSDIKPENLVFTSSGILKIIDFGLSLVSLPDLNSRQATYRVGGTPNFFSPLQMQAFTAYRAGSNPRSVVQHNPYKSDVYALGLVFLSMSSLKFIEGLNEGEQLEERLAREIEGIPAGRWMKDALTSMLNVNESRRPDFKVLKKLGYVEKEEQFSQ
jgi:serine/threonine protein kinase